MFWALAQRQKDIEKGRQEGREEGREDVIRELLEKNVPLFPRKSSKSLKTLTGILGGDRTSRESGCVAPPPPAGLRWPGRREELRPDRPRKGRRLGEVDEGNPPRIPHPSDRLRMG